MVGAAAQGTSHARAGTPCQDALAYQVLPGDVAAAVIADGAGTARFAAQAAQAAVSVSCEALGGLLSAAIPENLQDWQTLLRGVFSRARSAVLQQAEEIGDNPREFACTLTAVAVCETGLAIAQIGDGAVVALDAKGDLFSAACLQRGEYANETYFLTQDDALDRVEFQFYQGNFRGLALMSDGLLRLALKMPAQEPYPPFFEPLFRFLAEAEDESQAVDQLAGFLNSDRVNQRTDDDKTLILAVRISPQRGF